MDTRRVSGLRNRKVLPEPGPDDTRPSGTDPPQERSAELWEGSEEEDVQADSSTKFKLALIYVLLLVDIILAAYTDRIDADEVKYHVLVMLFKTCLLVGTVVAFFLHTASTFFAKLGLWGRYLRQFWMPYVSAFLVLATYLPYTTVQILMVHDNYPHIATWKRNDYWGLFILASLFRIGYQCSLVVAVNRSLNPRLYTAECLADI